MAKQLELIIQNVYLGDPRCPNPMVGPPGPGPVGARCGSCAFLEAWAYSKTYWKCSKRGDLTHGKATDQKKGWPACGLYEPTEA